MDSRRAAAAEERLLSSDFVSATAANFLNSFGSQMLVATLPVYVLALGGSRIEAGLVSGSLAFTALLLRPVVGWLTDAWRCRPLVLVGTFCYGLASIGYALATSVPVLLLGRVIHGFGLCNYTTAANAYVADIAPPKRRAEAVGLFAAAQAFGLITGPTVGFLIISLWGFPSLFYFSAVLAFSAFAVSFLAKERRPQTVSRRLPWTLRTGIVALDALPMAWTALCLGVGFGPVGAFIAIYATSRGVENPGLYFTVQAVALLFSRTFTGPLADRRGRAVVVIPGVIAVALSLATLPLANDLPQFLASAALYGLGFGMAQPATMALLIDRVRPERRGMAMSTYFTGFDLGIAVSSLALGMVSEAWGFGVMWYISAAGTLLGLLGLLGARNRSVKHVG